MEQSAYYVMIGALSIGFLFAIISAFRKRWSGITGFLFSFFEGIFAGVYTFYLEKNQPNITFTALILVHITMLLMYLVNCVIPKPPKRFEHFLDRAALIILAYYFMAMILGIYGINAPLLTSSDIYSIMFSVGVISIVSMRYLTNFDLISTCVISLRRNIDATKYMGWFSAFTVMTTEIWLLVEYLHLLVKLGFSL